MYKKIILSAFAKAQTETPGNTKTQWAGHLTDVLWLEHKYQVSRRTLLNYYNYYKDNQSDRVLVPKLQTIEMLCKYLCYPNYATYVMHQNGMSSLSNKESQKITYTLEGEDYKEKVTILIHREAIDFPSGGLHRAS